MGLGDEAISAQLCGYDGEASLRGDEYQLLCQISDSQNLDNHATSQISCHDNVNHKIV